jgi:hypothetical protein
MSINITKAFRSGLDILFNVAVELVRDVTYVRPASFSAATGLTTSAEQTAAVKALLTNYRPQELGTVVIQPGDEKVLLRTVELAGITTLSAGDYLIEAATGQRRDVLAAKLDATGLLWTLQTVRSLNEDWGDLNAATVSADWGDLSPASETEDWMALATQ